MMPRKQEGRAAALLGLGSLLLAVGCGASSDSGGTAGAGGQSSGAGNSNASAGANASASGNTSVGGSAGSGAGGSAGSGAGGSLGAAGGGSAVASCSAYANAYCAWELSCGANAFYEVFGTMDRCTAQRQASCLDRSAAPGIALSNAQLDACSASLTPSSCDAIHTACHFAGTLADGAPCAYDAQCQSRICLTATWNADCGVCGPAAPLGGACHQLNGCGDDATCSLGGDTRDTCVRMLPDGSACVASQFDCLHYNCANGVCQPAPRANEACSTPCDSRDDTECLGGICQQLVWHTAGGSCDSETGVLCQAGFDCNPVGGPGTCQQTAPQPTSVAADCK